MMHFFQGKRLALAAALAVFVLVFALGEMYIHNHLDEDRGELFKTNIANASKLRAQIEGELNSLLYLSSGLGGYLVVRNDNLKEKEVNDILGVLFRSSRHVRNFGVAVDYRIKYVFPREGNEKVIGIDYRDLPGQWPVVKKITESGIPVLAGPVNLVQGGRGLIYRVPLYIDKKYWGLLSTVIDLDSMINVVSAAVSENSEFAIRGKDGSGLKGDMVWGRAELFRDPESVIQEISIPGGSWAVAMKPASDQLFHNYLFVRLLVYPLALLAAWMMYMLVHSRAAMAELAMYDPLTSLPNRNLLEDRAEFAFARQKRKPEHVCAILFFDLDGFKGINDHYGHKAGDAILVAVARRATSILRNHDTVARWGGDEFIILLEEIKPVLLTPLINRLRDEIEKPIEFEGEILHVGVSVGLAIYPESGATLDHLLKMADQSMYADKQQRKKG